MQLTFAKAPMRISLGGGGTDIPSYAEKYGGLVVGFAITRYVTVSVADRSFDGALHQFGLEHQQVDNAEHLANPFLRAVLKRAKKVRNLQVAIISDAPAGTGLGGSGAYTVASLAAISNHGYRYPTELAEDASAVEIEDLGRCVGKQDHYFASLGGLKALNIAENGLVTVSPLRTSHAFERYVNDRLLLFFTGVSRDAGLVLARQSDQTRSGNDDVLDSLHHIRKIGEEVRMAIETDAIDDIGPLLHAHWQNKVRLSRGVTNEKIDQFYSACRRAGADGGKIMGAGGGGFMLLSVPRSKIESVRAEAAKFSFREISFSLEHNGVKTGQV